MSRRFGRGDFYIEVDRSWEDEPTERARDYFVQVIAQSLPDVVTTFRDRVVPVLDRAWDGYDESGGSLDRSTGAMLGLQQADFSHDSITSWASRWNVTRNGWLIWRLMNRAFSAWLLKHGLYTEGNGPNPKLAEDLWRGWSSLGHWLPVEEWVPDLRPEVRPVSLPGWEPTTRTWGEYRRWIENEELPHALADQKARAAEEPSLSRTPAKYDTDHFVALARWQLLGLSYRELGAGDPDHPLRKAVPRTADLVGLTRRT